MERNWDSKVGIEMTKTVREVSLLTDSEEIGWEVRM